MFIKVKKEFERVILRWARHIEKKRIICQEKTIKSNIQDDIDYYIEENVGLPENGHISKGCKIGRHTFLGRNCIVADDVLIGRFCSISVNVRIGACQHPLNFLSTHPFQYLKYMQLSEEYSLCNWKLKAPRIGNDVWIGVNVVIMDGVNVGDGAVIGANAVVTHDVPPYAIAAGVPARIIKYRFSPEIIDKLLELKWWDLGDKYLKDLLFDNIEECIDKLTEIRNNEEIIVGTEKNMDKQ